METTLRAATQEAPPLSKPWMRICLGAWHWLLTPGWFGHTSAAQLRGWARVLTWSTQGRAATLQRALTRPITAWRRAGKELESFGADVESVAGVPRRVQRWHLWWLEMRHGLSASSYVDFGLYDGERRRHAAAYVQKHELIQLIRWFDRTVRTIERYPIADKVRFSAWCQEHRLPSVTVLHTYVGGTVPTIPLPPADLFTKPARGSRGAGTTRWSYDPASATWRGDDGQSRTMEALNAELASRAGKLPPGPTGIPNGLVLQPAVRNHRDMRHLTPGGLSTVRVMTYREPDGASRVLMAVCKLPVGDAPADNFHFGGIIAPVALATGRLGPAMRRHGSLPMLIERHPDTGAVLEGQILPLWDETQAVTLRAFDAAPHRPLIGWDVAITDHGPVLLEGNTSPSPELLQIATGMPLGSTPFGAALEAHVRRAMGL